MSNSEPIYSAESGADSTKLDEACRKAMDLQLAGQLNDAERLYKSILEAQPLHAVANHCIGMLHVQSQRAADGIPHLLAALEAHPQNPDYWLGYLEALLQAGHTGDATQALGLARAHGLEGESVDNFAKRLEQSALVWAERRAGDALVAMTTFAKLNPDDAEACRAVGTQLLKLKRFDEAETYLPGAGDRPKFCRSLRSGQNL